MANTDWSDLKFVVDQLNHEFKLFNCQQIFVFLQKSFGNFNNNLL